MCLLCCLADDLSDADSQSSTVADEEHSPNSSEGGSSISMEEDAAVEGEGEDEDVDVADGDDIFGRLYLV